MLVHIRRRRKPSSLSTLVLSIAASIIALGLGTLLMVQSLQKPTQIQSDAAQMSDAPVTPLYAKLSQPDRSKCALRLSIAFRNNTSDIVSDLKYQILLWNYEKQYYMKRYSFNKTLLGTQRRIFKVDYGPDVIKPGFTYDAFIKITSPIQTSSRTVPPVVAHCLSKI